MCGNDVSACIAGHSTMHSAVFCMCVYTGAARWKDKECITHSIVVDKTLGPIWNSFHWKEMIWSEERQKESKPSAPVLKHLLRTEKLYVKVRCSATVSIVKMVQSFVFHNPCFATILWQDWQSNRQTGLWIKSRIVNHLRSLLQKTNFLLAFYIRLSTSTVRITSVINNAVRISLCSDLCFMTTLSQYSWTAQCILFVCVAVFPFPSVIFQQVLRPCAAAVEEETAAGAKWICAGMEPWSLRKTLTLRLPTPSFTKMRLTKSCRLSSNWKVQFQHVCDCSESDIYH